MAGESVYKSGTCLLLWMVLQVVLLKKLIDSGPGETGNFTGPGDVLLAELHEGFNILAL